MISPPTNVDFLLTYINKIIQDLFCDYVSGLSYRRKIIHQYLPDNNNQKLQSFVGRTSGSYLIDINHYLLNTSSASLSKKENFVVPISTPSFEHKIMVSERFWDAREVQKFRERITQPVFKNGKKVVQYHEGSFFHNHETSRSEIYTLMFNTLHTLFTDVIREKVMVSTNTHFIINVIKALRTLRIFLQNGSLPMDLDNNNSNENILHSNQDYIFEANIQLLYKIMEGTINHNIEIFVGSTPCKVEQEEERKKIDLLYKFYPLCMDSLIYHFILNQAIIQNLQNIYNTAGDNVFDVFLTKYKMENKSSIEMINNLKELCKHFNDVHMTIDTVSIVQVFRLGLIVMSNYDERIKDEIYLPLVQICKGIIEGGDGTTSIYMIDQRHKNDLLQGVEEFIENNLIFPEDVEIEIEQEEESIVSTAITAAARKKKKKRKKVTKEKPSSTSASAATPSGATPSSAATLSMCPNSECSPPQPIKIPNSNDDHNWILVTGRKNKCIKQSPISTTKHQPKRNITSSSSKRSDAVRFEEFINDVRHNEDGRNNNNKVPGDMEEGTKGGGKIAEESAKEDDEKDKDAKEDDEKDTDSRKDLESGRDDKNSTISTTNISTRMTCTEDTSTIDKMFLDCVRLFRSLDYFYYQNIYEFYNTLYEIKCLFIQDTVIEEEDDIDLQNFILYVLFPDFRRYRYLTNVLRNKYDHDVRSNRLKLEEYLKHCLRLRFFSLSIQFSNASS